jgi:hypothetical protein
MRTRAVTIAIKDDLAEIIRRHFFEVEPTLH